MLKKIWSISWKRPGTRTSPTARTTMQTAGSGLGLGTEDEATETYRGGLPGRASSIVLSG
ncbi:MAG: hypothetical protein JWN05_706 [Arthrobacter sp.]|jgi:hypothetical protein|nr:hypothetical protein [Arthrobacter sp.]